MLMTSHVLWYLVMFTSMLMIPWYFIVTQIFLYVRKTLQDDIDSVVCWIVSNKLWINVSKTETMLIGSCQWIGHQHLAVNIGGNPLCHVSVAKYLGLYIDRHLTWQQHIDHIVSASKAQLYCLWRLHVSTYLMYQLSFYYSFVWLLCSSVDLCLAKQINAV